jgi:hypothetical protein
MDDGFFFFFQVAGLRVLWVSKSTQTKVLPRAALQVKELIWTPVPVEHTAQMSFPSRETHFWKFQLPSFSASHSEHIWVISPHIWRGICSIIRIPWSTGVSLSSGSALVHEFMRDGEISRERTEDHGVDKHIFWHVQCDGMILFAGSILLGSACFVTLQPLGHLRISQAMMLSTIPLWQLPLVCIS